MNINKNIEGNTLKIIIEGRIDTNSVQKLDDEFSCLDGIEHIIFDFEKVEYISSSGLRFILKCKKNIEDTKIINCTPEVYDIFDMTGFSEIMNVEKTLRKISIENCEKIGEGFFGNIYRIDPETIVKVYKIPDIELIKNEKELARKAFVMGIPTAIPYDIVKVDNTYGAVFELLNAKQVANLINSDKDLEEFARKSSEILKDMHQTIVDKGELPNRKEIVISLLKECESLFSQKTYNKLNNLLESIPDTNNLLHCDFHVKNIMLQNNELLLIDMDKLSVGHPIFEFASMYATYYAFACVDKKNTEKFLGMPLDVTSKLFYKTFKYYYENKNEEELESIIFKLSIISYIQILNLRFIYKDNTNTMQQEEIEFCIKYLTENAEKLDTLNY